MKTVFMGTPEFAVPALLMLAESGGGVALVITQQDKAKDRGKQMKPTPVKEAALSLNIPVLQPEKLSGNQELLTALSEINPDLIVVAAYGKLLPKEILELPRLGCINIHASLLPRHRGASPIARAVMEGDAESGVTLMHMAEGLDTGDMIARAKTPVDAKTAEELHGELAELGAALLRDTLPAIEAGKAERVPQDEKYATYAPMIFKKDGHMDFSLEPAVLSRQVRGLIPWPGAYTVYNGETMKIWSARDTGEKSNVPFGMITEVSAEGIRVSAGGGTLLLTEIQMPGKKKMPVSEYLRGNKIEKLAVLG